MDTRSTVEQRGLRTRSQAIVVNVPALSAGLSRNVTMSPDLMGNDDAARALQKIHEKVFRNDLVSFRCAWIRMTDIMYLLY